MILFLWADLASSSLPRPEGENSFRCAAGKVAVIGVEGDEDRIISYRVWGFFGPAERAVLRKSKSHRTNLNLKTNFFGKMA